MIPETNSPGRILVADDDPAMCELVAEQLSALGPVEVIYGGEALKARLEAAASGRAEVPGVVVSDVRMPSYGGLDALRFVQRMMPEVAVVLVTAFGDAFLHLRAKELGAFAVVDKPFAGPEIVETVAHAAECSRLTSAASGDRFQR